MRATLLSVEHLSDSLTTFFFEPERPVQYLAGQFTELHLLDCPPDERGTYRQFTLSSSPTEPSLAVTVNFADSHSSYKSTLRRLDLGATVQIDEPLGDFVLPLDASAPMVWIAGGIGITPFRSMAKFLADTHESRAITLFHSVADAAEAPFEEELRAANVTRHLIDTSKGSRLTARDVVRGINSTDEPYYYISGPEGMVTAFVADLLNCHIAKERIIIDAFLGYR